MAISGSTAKSLVGGEFPVPVARDQQGNVTIQFKPFGVGLSFTPVVLSSGRISLQVSTEVSELTNTGAFFSAGSSVTDPTTGVTTTTQGLSIPALAVRRAETTVEMPSGGTAAFAGLMSHTSKQELDAFPGLKDLPVLGALFRSRDYQNNETELVILVTAYIAEPGREKDFALPTDGFIAPADPETILLGKLNAVYKREGTQALKPTAQAPVGFIVQ
jgi:pilus assembly protein CpaC